MLVKDTVRLQRDAATNLLEAYEERVNRWTFDCLNRCVVVPGDQDTPLNPYRQLGHALPYERLERLVAALSPRLMCEVHPANDARGVIWKLLPEGRDYVSAYDRALVPELSVFRGRWVWEADPDYRFKTVNRADVPGAGVSIEQAHTLLKELGPEGALSELQKRAADTDPDARPGQKRVLKKAGEAIRGWRTHVVKCLQQGACTLGDIERVLPAFGLPMHLDNASWAVATGRRTDTVASLV